MRSVQLVGSVPLPTTEDVFRLLAGALGTLARRLPDGETGKRSYWITSQAYLLARHPQFEPAGHNWDPDSGDVPEGGAPKYRLKAGVAPDAVELPPLGYAGAARESYALFARLKRESVIDRSTRFQVSLPTPLAFIAGLIDPPSQAAVAPAFEAAILGELREIVGGIPLRELAIQWDVCLEIFILEGLRQAYFPRPFEGCIARLVALGNAVPAEAELGYHFCYGDFRHKHGVEPKDTALMVEMTNALVAGLERPVSWVHYPVPRDRTDDAYYAPLARLELPPQSELYLGLVHNTDGLEGSRRRLDVARRHRGAFGVATECGFGRRPAETLPQLLKIHADLARGAGAARHEP
ncbi:MAG: hypothetical protein ACM3N5_14240 [Candidatus Eiseniibacteriota bacterium]